MEGNDTEVLTRPFKVFEIQVRLTQPATGKAVEGRVELLELELEAVVLQVPSGSCMQGKPIHFRVATLGRGQEIAFTAAAKVTRQSLESGGQASRDTVVLTFQKHDSDEWQVFRDLFVDRQQQAILLFDRLKE